MSEDFIPDSQFKPDQEKPTPSASNAPDFVPDEHFKSDEETYGSPSQTLKAGVEGLERGLTFGLSDIARTKLENYLPESMQTKPEEIKARMEENPIASGVGNVLGGAVVLGATGGVGGALPEGAGLAARLGASAAEGSLFGAGNAVTDYALGDPELNAQKIASEVGFGALLGGGS